VTDDQRLFAVDPVCDPKTSDDVVVVMTMEEFVQALRGPQEKPMVIAGVFLREDLIGFACRGCSDG
jgi:hypothetical protein